ncbi:spore maturation protein A [Thermacetogenium phaeum DSM 12270]|uniref:Spore maturation protein A n=1 Tax=Thermacetogenium phaeum (strain ATCC BAA-254 / DSM 26808 / PB) TaxID=1089553 RepID=K4LFM2_THEPS|nr:nucleoside recognition domain-containing protein [Thermacetogenium phaeum]AFV11791.1 spore maturation protein A [Thermacetogenium phaeum DSM 12270]
MLNLIWLCLILAGVVVAAGNGRIDIITETFFSAADEGVKVCLDLIGLMTLWLGMLEVARQAGLIRILARLVRPLAVRLFPEVPPEHPALGAIIMNISANILGLGNAATPFGLKAMEELQKLNPRPDTASDAMCTFLAANTSCITLVPATIIGVRIAAGSVNPTEIVGPTIFATGFSMAFVLLLDSLWRNFIKTRRRVF